MHREFLEDRPALHFGNRIQEIVDEVDLFLAAPDLRWLLERLDWALVENPHLVAPLLARFESNYDGGAVRAPFLEALLAAKELAQRWRQGGAAHALGPVAAHDDAARREVGPGMRRKSSA